MQNQKIYRRCDGVSRRDFLRVGGLTALGLSLPDLLRLRRASATMSREPGRAKNCILIWLDGGPSHLETFDPKPDAPAEVRGPLGAIGTKLPGIYFSECMERTAERMERIAVIRSMTSPLGEHNFGTHYLLSGYKPTAAVEYPAFTSVATHLRGQQGALPANVAVPHYRVGGGKFSGAGYLPVQSAPFSLEADPSKPDFRVRDLDFFPGLDESRLDRRMRYLARLDAFSRTVEEGDSLPADADFEQAYRLVVSRDAKAAFDLSDEPDEIRRRYGQKTIGQSCLLARRLVERGVPFVTVNNTGWDTHNDLYTRLKEGYTGANVPVGLAPSLDMAFAALLDDLDDRGILDSTLVVVMGEFGRTPKINTAGGRDHWPRVFSIALAGGGVRGGQVIGESDSTGEGPRERPVTPADLACTIYTLMGIEPQTELQTSDGRPIRVAPPDGEAVRELFT